MKRLLITSFAALVLSPFSFAEMHEFTSADGSKKLRAEVLSYDAQTSNVELLLPGRQRITTSATAFSEEDQKFIEKSALALEAGRNLWIEVGDVATTVSEKRNASNGYQTLNLSNGFEIRIRNNGKSDFTGLKAEYQIFTSVYKDPFEERPKKTDEVKYGTVEVAALKPRDETAVTTDKVPLTTIRKLPLSQCVGGT